MSDKQRYVAGKVLHQTDIVILRAVKENEAKSLTRVIEHHMGKESW